MTLESTLRQWLIQMCCQPNWDKREADPTNRQQPIALRIQRSPECPQINKFKEYPNVHLVLSNFLNVVFCSYQLLLFDCSNSVCSVALLEH